MSLLETRQRYTSQAPTTRSPVGFFYLCLLLVHLSQDRLKGSRTNGVCLVYGLFRVTDTHDAIAYDVSVLSRGSCVPEVAINTVSVSFNL